MTEQEKKDKAAADKKAAEEKQAAADKKAAEEKQAAADKKASFKRNGRGEMVPIDEFDKAVDKSIDDAKNAKGKK